jgi:hypothetical protein
MRDYALGSTFDFKFPSRDADGVPTTLAGTPVVSAYVDNSTTQITAGITLSVDFDGVTGLNNVRVVASSGNGYAAGSNYALVITTGTVDGISVVGEVVGEFSLEAQSALRPTTAGRTLDVSATGEAGLDFANASEPSGAIPALGILTSGTMQAGSTSTTAKLASGTNFADNLLNNQVVVYIYAGLGAGQTREALDWDDSDDLVTVEDWDITPDDTSKYVVVIIPRPPTSAANLPLVRAYDHTGSGAIATATELAGAVTSLNTLLGRLTATRAGYIDNISVATATNTDMATVLGRLTATRAGYLDNLSAGVVPTAALNAAATWNATMASHLTSGSTGAALNGAGAAGDPWGTTLPGAYGSGTAGFILANRASQASVDTVDDFLDTEIAAIKAKTDNLPSDPADASDVTAQFATVNSTLATIGGYLDTEIAAIKVKTDNLPADTATVLDTIDNLLDTEVAAIKAKTDQLTFGATNTVNANFTHVKDLPLVGDADTPFDVE